jgi:hypothetical protein
MVESRGRKAKKAWQMQVGRRELISTGVAMAGLVMLSFALGILAGRGDIYRVMHNWGLLGPDSGKVGQVWYQAPPPPTAAPVVALASPASQEAPHAEKTPPHHTHVAPKAPSPPPSQANIIAAPNPVTQPNKKKSPKQGFKAKEDKLDKIRREMASKLKFQNSLDLAATRGTSSGEKSKRVSEKEQTAAVKSATTTQAVLVKYRNSAQARAKLAQMQKQGEKVVLKEGKDQEGQYFAICRQVAAKPPEPHHVAQAQVKKTKPESKSNKTSAGEREATRR